MAVVLLTNDVTVISSVEGAAKMWSEPVRAFASVGPALLECSLEQPKLLVIDLAAPSLDVKRLIEALHQVTYTRPHVVAFGPHVHEERLIAAREAGCDEVLSRGQFFGQLKTILGRTQL